MQNVNKSGLKLKLKEWAERISAGQEERMVFQEGSKLSNAWVVVKCMVQINDVTNFRESSVVGVSGK